MKVMPTVGDAILYFTTKEDKDVMRNLPNCNVQDVLPGVVTAGWGPTLINAHVFFDGEGSIWKTSIEKGKEEMNWCWPDEYEE